MDIDKRLKKLEKQNKKGKTLKKFKGDYTETDNGTKLEPYQRTRINVRDIEDLIEDDDQEREFEQTSEN